VSYKRCSTSFLLGKAYLFQNKFPEATQVLLTGLIIANNFILSCKQNTRKNWKMVQNLFQSHNIPDSEGAGFDVYSVAA
jgi:hypothetical protein